MDAIHAAHSIAAAAPTPDSEDQQHFDNSDAVESDELIDEDPVNGSQAHENASILLDNSDLESLTDHSESDEPEDDSESETGSIQDDNGSSLF